MTALPETKSVDLSLENGWLTVWFNQPERRTPSPMMLLMTWRSSSPRYVMIAVSGASHLEAGAAFSAPVAILRVLTRSPVVRVSKR